MKTKKIAHALIPSAVLLCLTLAQPVQAYQSPEAQNFISGFNSFKKQDYGSAIRQFSKLLEQPESQLRELTLVFLARSYFKEGNIDETAYLLHLWQQEFPNSDLKTTLEPDLMNKTAKSDIRGILARKEQERIAREKAEQERLAAIKAEKERKAREKADAERIAREKAAAERLANHKAAIYAAVTTPRQLVALPAEKFTAVAGKEMTIPLTITNPGIMPDSFSLATVLPNGWKSHFALDGTTVTATPEIAPGASTKVQLSLVPPVSILEGQQLAVPVRLTSQLATDRAISGDIGLVASAPIIRAVVKKLDAVDGDPARSQCLVSVLNVGSADAENLNVTVTHPASYTPVSDGSVSYTTVSGESIRIGNVNLPSGGLQEFLVTFKRKGNSSAGVTCKAHLTLE